MFITGDLGLRIKKYMLKLIVETPFHVSRKLCILLLNVYEVYVTGGIMTRCDGAVTYMRVTSRGALHGVTLSVNCYISLSHDPGLFDALLRHEIQLRHERQLRPSHDSL